MIQLKYMSTITFLTAFNSHDISAPIIIATDDSCKYGTYVSMILDSFTYFWYGDKVRGEYVRED